jgi:hypothetical protein
MCRTRRTRAARSYGEKMDMLVAAPAMVVTVIGPCVAPAGTCAVILVAEFTVNVAETPLNVTDVAAEKFAPTMATFVPAGALTGVKLEILGATVKLVAVIDFPPAAMIEIRPDLAFVGTVAVTCVGDVTT